MCCHSVGLIFDVLNILDQLRQEEGKASMVSKPVKMLDQNATRGQDCQETRLQRATNSLKPRKYAEYVDETLCYEYICANQPRTSECIKYTYKICIHYAGNMKALWLPPLKLKILYCWQNPLVFGVPSG